MFRVEPNCRHIKNDILKIHHYDNQSPEDLSTAIFKNIYISDTADSA
jgi:hypothetical protein